MTGPLSHGAAGPTLALTGRAVAWTLGGPSGQGPVRAEALLLSSWQEPCDGVGVGGCLRAETLQRGAWPAACLARCYLEGRTPNGPLSPRSPSICWEEGL